MEEAKVKKISPGGRCWFGVESKSFELLLESVNGKVAGKIAERGRGCSLWIRFGERSLAWLLEGMEDCIVGKFREPFRMCGTKVEGATRCCCTTTKLEDFCRVQLCA